CLHYDMDRPEASPLRSGRLGSDESPNKVSTTESAVMADIVTDDFLRTMKSRYPTEQASLTSPSDVLNNPWWIPVAVAFSAGNRPDAVPIVFKFALSDLVVAQKKFHIQGDKAHREQLLLARKFRDVLFKGDQCIECLARSHARRVERYQNNQTSLVEHEEHGRQFFSSLYGDEANRVQGLLDSILPEMGWFSNTVAYGHVYGFTGVTNQLETLYTLVGSLITVDTPLQVRAVRQIAIEASNLAGVVRRNQVPDVDEVGDRGRLSAGSQP
ncbi:12976_t:CDS:2, partial [Acaulospora colombiana]